MINFILLAIILLIVGAAVAYIVKEKKRGVRCVGCSMSGACSGKCAGASGCRGHSENN